MQMILMTLIIYHGCLIALGLYASKKTTDNSSFLIGDRALGGWVAGLSYAATSSSAWVLMGFSGFVYAVGLSALWMLVGIWGGYILAWIIIGQRLHQRAHQRRYVTLTDLLSDQADGKLKRPIIWLSSLFILFCFIFYIAAQLQAAGAAMNNYFGLSIPAGVIIATLVIGIYSVLGGFWAVSLTDMLQGAMMGVIAIIVPLSAVIAAGGPDHIVLTLQNDFPAHLDIWGGHVGWVGLGAILGLVSIGLGTLGQPQLLSRIMAVRSDGERRKAFAIAMSWSVIVFSGMAVLGLAGRALTVEISNPEQILFAVTDMIFPQFIAGLILAALLSAVMSTVDSILVSSTAAISHDLNLYPQRPMVLSRIALTALMVFAVYIALSAPATIFERVLFAWTALGAAFGPVLIARLFNWTSQATPIFLAMTSGFSIAVIFNQFLDAGSGQLLERVLPWVISLAILYFWPRKKASHESAS